MAWPNNFLNWNHGVKIVNQNLFRLITFTTPEVCPYYQTNLMDWSNNIQPPWPSKCLSISPLPLSIVSYYSDMKKGKVLSPKMPFSSQEHINVLPHLSFYPHKNTSSILPHDQTSSKPTLQSYDLHHPPLSTSTKNSKLQSYIFIPS